MQRDMAYYNAFNSLNRSRQSGGMGGSSPILVSEVLAYCQLVGIASGKERVKYLNLVQDLDQICLTHWAEEQKKKQKTPK